MAERQWGAVSHLIISMGRRGGTGEHLTEEVSSILSMYPGLDLKTTGDRATAIEEGRSRISTLSSMFFVFGSFSIIAGIALIINIFTMLGRNGRARWEWPGSRDEKSAPPQAVHL